MKKLSVFAGSVWIFLQLTQIAYGDETRILSDGEMEKLFGADVCKNCLKGADNNPEDDDTKDPVFLNNGASRTTFVSDIYANSLGPDLRLTRTYNSFVTSQIDGLTPIPGSGPWCVVREESELLLDGHGDRILTDTNLWDDFSTTVDARTVSAGTNTYDVAHLMFRYVDRYNFYYTFIDTDGVLQLAKIVDNHVTVLDTEQLDLIGGQSPCFYESEIKVVTSGSNIKVYYNGGKEIDTTDTSLASGQVGLESYYSHSRFDDFIVGDGTDTETYNFNVDDNNTIFGHGWTTEYDVRVMECSCGSIQVCLSDGQKNIYTPNEDGSYSAGYRFYDKLEKDVSGYYLTTKHGIKYTFDTSGLLDQIEDRNGNTLTVTYTQYGGVYKLTTITDETGRTITFDYTGFLSNNVYWVTTATDPLGREINYSYENDNLSHVTKATGEICDFDYADTETNMLLGQYTTYNGDIFGYEYYYNARMAVQTDPEGKETSFDFNWDTTWLTNNDNRTAFYHFDTEGNTTKFEDLLSNDTYSVYDANGHLASRTDQLGRVSRWDYDDTGNMLLHENPQGDTEFYTYSEDFNLLTSLTDRNGEVSTFAYDDEGNLTETTDKRGKVTEYVYSAEGLLTSTTDALENVKEYEYDTNGNRTTFTDANDAVTNYAYDEVGNLTEIMDPLERVTTYEYDESNNLTSQTDPLENVTEFEYDGRGNLTSLTNAENETTNFKYSFNDELIKTTDAEDRVTTKELDSTWYMFEGSTSLVSLTDGNGNITNYGYDYAGNLINTLDAEDRTDTFNYDPTKQMTKLVDPRNNDVNFEYDGAGRLTRELFIDATNNRFAYDKAGHLTLSVDGEGDTTLLSYDEAGNLTEMDYPDTTDVSYGYDDLGRMTTASDENGDITLVYDPEGQLISTTDTNNKIVSYEYDPAGNMTRLVYPDGSYAMHLVDADDRTDTIEYWADDVLCVEATMAYDDVDRRTLLDMKTNDTHTRYAYNDASELLSLTNANTISTLASYAYTYDKAGNRTTMNDGDDTIVYTYDKTYQLTDVDLPDSTTVSYTFDLAGNRTLYEDANGDTEEYTTNAVNQYTIINDTHGYDFDDNGNMLSKTINDELTLFDYDFSNQLSNVTAYTAGGSVSYKYDALGRLIERSKDGTITKYVYAGARVIAELDSDDTVTTTYVYGIGIDEVLAMKQGNTIYYYNYDGLGTVRTIRNSSGNLVERYHYDEYGNFEIEDDQGDTQETSSIDNRFYFTGREFDEFTGLYNYRARWYDPYLGKFLQRDPIKFAGGDLNLYRYVKNNPVNWVDPYGENPLITAIIKGIGKLIIRGIGSATGRGAGTAPGDLDDGSGDLDANGTPDYLDDWDGDGIENWQDDSDSDGRRDDEDPPPNKNCRP